MAKKKSYLDELEQYQREQYLPHSSHIQNGELPFRTRQIMKQGIKKKLFLFFVLAPASLSIVIQLKERLNLEQEQTKVLIAAWLAALALALVLIILSSYLSARQNKK